MHKVLWYTEISSTIHGQAGDYKCTSSTYFSSTWVYTIIRVLKTIILSLTPSSSIMVLQLSTLDPYLLARALAPLILRNIWFFLLVSMCSLSLGVVLHANNWTLWISQASVLTCFFSLTFFSVPSLTSPVAIPCLSLARQWPSPHFPRYFCDLHEFFILPYFPDFLNSLVFYFSFSICILIWPLLLLATTSHRIAEGSVCKGLSISHFRKSHLKYLFKMQPLLHPPKAHTHTKSLKITIKICRLKSGNQVP